MPLAILKVLGGLVGIIAAWYISKKIAAFATGFIKAWNQHKDEIFKQEQQKRYEALKNEAEKQKAAVDKWLDS